MDLANFLIQLLNGLAGASSLFLVGAGLSLIFGITRVVNFAHGSLYMLGLYIAYSLTEWLTGKSRIEIRSFEPAVVDAAVGGLPAESKHAAALCKDGVQALLRTRSPL